MTAPVKDALSTLNRHAGLVADALKAPLDVRDGVPLRSIMDLRHASAVRPTAEEGYRLHPRLREYLFDHLQHYPAYQSLSEIGSHITTMNALWRQVEEMRGLGDLDSTTELQDRLQDTIYDIVDNMRRNLQQLQTLLSTRYGNVRSLEAKKSQNRWYQQQSTQLIHHLGLLAHSAARVEQAATAFGMYEFAQFLRRNLLALVLDWQQSMTEMQNLLTREIFQTHRIEKHHRQLARMDMLLRQQPGWTGVDIDLDGALPDFLLATRLPAIRPHIEPEDTDAEIHALIVDTASALPPLQTSQAPQEERRYKRRKIDSSPPALTPAILASERLRLHVLACTEGVSLVDWRCSDADAMSMQSCVWLCFAMQYLRMQGIRVTVVRNPPRPGERWSHTFGDAIASGPARIWAKATLP